MSCWDVLIIGSGHAGCEAVNAACIRGVSVCLVLDSLNNFVRLSCNPSVGGVGKGHLVIELDALGGLMAQVADSATVHAKMLNESKGHAVRAPRCQIDCDLYPANMKSKIVSLSGLHIVEGFVEDFVIEYSGLITVHLRSGKTLVCRKLVIATGTFLGGELYIGDKVVPGGRIGEPAATGLRQRLLSLGLRLKKLKTGTSPRINKNSVNLELLEEQPDNPDVRLSKWQGPVTPSYMRRSAYICKTTAATKAIISAHVDKEAFLTNLERVPGPRYCPSLEAKFLRFPHKDSHQLFVEFMGINSDELYISGLSMGLSEEMQHKVVHSIAGFENAIILKPAYAIRYDIIDFGQISETMELRNVPGVFVCGQINGTTGYEEAAVQGFVAGVNAANQVLGTESYVPSKFTSYIGVLIDDLVHKEHCEPYRMFTSRSPFRLLFSSYNADIRLFNDIEKANVLAPDRRAMIKRKRDLVEGEIERLSTCSVKHENMATTISQLLKNNSISYLDLVCRYPNIVLNYEHDVNMILEMHFKYEGYIHRLNKEIDTMLKYEHMLIVSDFDFNVIKNISEAGREHLCRMRPNSIGGMSRIAALSASDFHHTLLELLRNRALKTPA